MFGIKNAKDAYRLVGENGCNTLVYTSGAENVHLYTNQFSRVFSIPKIIPKSTIGAGDNFNAGIIFSLIGQHIFKKDINLLDALKWDKIIESGIELSQEVCKSFDNYISETVAERILKRH
jgi:fructokinase